MIRHQVFIFPNGAVGGSNHPFYRGEDFHVAVFVFDGPAVLFQVQVPFPRLLQAGTIEDMARLLEAEDQERIRRIAETVRRVAGMPDENKLESVNQNLEVKIDAENPGEYYLVLVSDFVFDEGKQVTHKPIRREGPKVGRNDPCPCGSGKKFKKCCGKAA